jgi:hypothetical protein
MATLGYPADVKLKSRRSRPALSFFFGPLPVRVPAARPSSCLCSIIGVLSANQRDARRQVALRAVRLRCAPLVTAFARR